MSRPHWHMSHGIHERILKRLASLVLQILECHVDSHARSLERTGQHHRDDTKE